MTLTIQDIIESVFKAIKGQGISLSQNKYNQIKKNADKIIKDLLKSRSNDKAKFSVIIPCDETKASVRNKTVRKFIKTIKPCVQWEFELSKKTLTLNDSYDIFESEISTLPLQMTVDKKKKPYSYVIKDINKHQ